MTRSANLAEELAAARALITICGKDTAEYAELPAPAQAALVAMNAVRRILFAMVQTAKSEDDALTIISAVTVDMGEHVAINLNSLPDDVRPAIIQDFFAAMNGATQGWSLVTSQTWETPEQGSVH